MTTCMQVPSIPLPSSWMKRNKGRPQGWLAISAQTDLPGAAAREPVVTAQLMARGPKSASVWHASGSDAVDSQAFPSLGGQRHNRSDAPLSMPQPKSATRQEQSSISASASARSGHRQRYNNRPSQKPSRSATNSAPSQSRNLPEKIHIDPARSAAVVHQGSISNRKSMAILQRDLPPAFDPSSPAECSADDGTEANSRVRNYQQIAYLGKTT